MGLLELESENHEAQQPLERIENRLKRIEKDLAMASEDQLFIGLVFSLAVFLGTLPFSDLTQFFQDFAKFTAENGATVAQAIKFGSVLCLLLSTAARYYGIVVGRVRPSKAARAVSLELLIMAWNAFLFSFVISIIFNLSIILAVWTIPVAAIVALIVFICMARVENKILSFYASRYLIFKRDVTPVVSSFFQFLAVSMYIVFFALAVLLSFGVVSSADFATYYLVGWLLLFILIMLSSSLRRRKRAVNAWRLRAKSR